jgi:hypothetical protein
MPNGKMDIASDLSFGEGSGCLLDLADHDLARMHPEQVDLHTGGCALESDIDAEQQVRVGATPSQRAHRK